MVVDSFVSNLGLTGDSEAAVGRFGNLARAAFSFTTGPNRGGYRLTSVTLRLRRGDDTLEGDAVPTEIKIYRDSDGVPGSEFFRLSHLGHIGDMPQSYTNRTFYRADRCRYQAATQQDLLGRSYWH